MDYNNSKFAGKRKFIYKSKTGTIKALHLELDDNPNSSLHNSMWLYENDKLTARAEFTKAGIKWLAYIFDKVVTGTIPFNKIEFID